MRRLRIGDLTMLRLTDAAPPPALWTYAFPAAEAGDAAAGRWAPDGLFHTAFAAHALIADGTVTLVDAGLGPEPSAYFGGLAGRLDREMAAAGLAPDMVSCVMLTHLHLDHVGWASAGGAPCFPNASYVLPAAELAHWRRAGADAALPHHVAAFERCVAPLLDRGLMDGLDDGQPAPGGVPLRYMPLPGHTPGHAAVVHGDGALVIAGDAWHSPAQVERPDWGHRADRDGPAAARSRVELARYCAARRATVAAGHFPEDVGIGVVDEAEGGFNWRPTR